MTVSTSSDRAGNPSADDPDAVSTPAVSTPAVSTPAVSTPAAPAPTAPSSTTPDPTAPALTSLSGLELLRAWAEFGDGDRPTIGRLLGMTPRSIEEGTVSFALTPRPDFSNPLGTMHGGICATLLDSVTGCAIHTTLPAGVGYTTLELKINYIRTVQLTDDELIGTGRVIHRGRCTATAEGRVETSEGKLVAHATTTCLILS